jgi:ribosomal protein L6P/L9E
LLWHEIYGPNNSTNHSLKTKRKVLTVLKKNKFLVKLPQKPNKTIHIHDLPYGWKLIVVLNKTRCIKHIILYSDIYMFYLPIFSLKNTFYFDSSTKQVIVSPLFLSNQNSLYTHMLKLFYNNLTTLFFTKLKFKGKGYYIYKNYRNTITPQFGYSHRLYLYSPHNYIRFLSKTSLVLFGLNVRDVSISAKKLFMWRPVNIFTGRGVRFSKQIFYKKLGKVSSYR